MDKPLKERLLGALVLVSLAVIFIPMLFDEPKSGTQALLSNKDMPAPPAWSESAVEFTMPEALRTAETTPASSTPPMPVEQTASVPVSTERIAPLPEENLEAMVPPPVLVQPPVQVAKAEQGVAVASLPKQPQKMPVTPAAIPTLEKPEAYAVQLATFSKKDNAKVLMEKLRAKGYDAYLREAFGEGARVRVLVGPRIERKKAEQLRDKLQADFALNGFIIPYQPIEG